VLEAPPDPPLRDAWREAQRRPGPRCAGDRGGERGRSSCLS